MASYYLRVQALTPVDGGINPATVPVDTTGSFWGIFTDPLPLSLIIFLLLTGVGLIALVVTKTQDVNKILTLLFLALMTSAIPFGLQLAGQKTRIESKAGTTVVPRNLIIEAVTVKGFKVSWDTDSLTAGSVALRTSKEAGLTSQVFSEPEGTKSFHHMIEVNQVKPETDYFMEILSGSQWFNMNGDPIVVKIPAK